jgi:hypothetical protein
MKYLLSVLSTSLSRCSRCSRPLLLLSLSLLLPSLLLASCSGRDRAITMETPVAESAEPSAEPLSETEENKDEAATDEADAKDKVDGEVDGKLDTEGAEQKNVTLVVDDQKTVGQIIIKEISTSRDGWVSIHQSRGDGSIVLPESIGEARVDSGDSEEIVVDLWETPSEGEKLWALLHIDAGERGTYEFPEKDIPVKKNGEAMARSFVVNGEEPKKADAEESEDSGDSEATEESGEAEAPE